MVFSSSCPSVRPSVTKVGFRPFKRKRLTLQHFNYQAWESSGLNRNSVFFNLPQAILEIDADQRSFFHWGGSITSQSLINKTEVN